jgi:predicted nucleotidyltransferase
MSLTEESRQDAVLKQLAEYVEESAVIGAMVVVGSFAAGTADAVSDLDLFFITYQGRFEDAWNRRRDLHVTGAIVEWDLLDAQDHPVGGHHWLSPELVLVESVISGPHGGGRLTEPLRLVAGDPELLHGFPRRAPIQDDEMTDVEQHPVDIAYDAFKRAVRERASSRRPRSGAP